MMPQQPDNDVTKLPFCVRVVTCMPGARSPATPRHRAVCKWGIEEGHSLHVPAAAWSSCQCTVPLRVSRAALEHMLCRPNSSCAHLKAEAVITLVEKGFVSNGSQRQADRAPRVAQGRLVCLLIIRHVAWHEVTGAPVTEC